MADELTVIGTGSALMAEIPDDFGSAKLSGDGIPIRDGGGVQMRDGSSGSPIKLPKLEAKSIESAFKFILILTADKILNALLANPDPTKLYLVSRDGSIQFEELDVTVCFNPDSICECPNPDWVVGWREQDGRLCMTRYTPTVEEDFWVDSATIDISGVGIPTNPYRASVIKSDDVGNRLTIMPDGLYVGVLATTVSPTTTPPTTVPPTTVPPTTIPPTTPPPTTAPPTTTPPTTVPPTTTPPTTTPPTTVPPTTIPPTTIPPTTTPPTTVPPTTTPPTTTPPTTPPPVTPPPTTVPPTTPPP